MTEEDWITGVHPADMLSAVRPLASRRKLRLFACACCRQIYVWGRLRHRDVVETVERWAEDVSCAEEVAEAINAIRQEYRMGAHWNPSRVNRPLQSVRMILELANPDDWEAANGVIREGVALLGPVRGELLHDVFVNPFRPPAPLFSEILTWNDGTVRRIAQGIYEERRLPEGTFDTGRLAILSDALLDAGCDNEALIAHCRSPGPHVRGCWAIDLILEKV